MTTTVKLSQLKPGHEYPGASLNARSTGRDDGLDVLIASIKADGLLQSLLVCPSPGNADAYYVIAGNRRLAALKKIGGDPDVPVIVRTDATPGTALAMSLSENITQVPLHPVDRYEAFAAMVSGGRTEADVAAAFAVSPRTVKQSLALGRLAPTIRHAWRKEDLDAETAQAFTLAKDHKSQEAIYAKLKKRRALSRYQVRQEIVGDQQDTKRFMSVVGRDAYEKAGGKIQVDLFARQRGGKADEDDDGELLVSDNALLVRLAGEAIDAKCKELIADGWLWAMDKDDAPQNARWDWRRTETQAASAPAAQKAKAGCLVEIDFGGKLKVEYGYIKPGAKGDKSKEGKGADKAKPKSLTVLSNSLRQDMQSMAARATQDALRNDSYGDDRATLLANIVAGQITPDRYNYMPSQVREKLGAIRDSITTKVMNDALRKRFDTKRYFSSAPKNLVIKAIAEVMGPEHAKKLAGGTKAAAWKFALANLPKTNWLPPELRAAHYDGPAAKAAAKKPKAKPAKLKKAA